MAHAKAYLRYHAYEKLSGHFPTDKVIFYYKGFGCTKRMFKEIDRERGIEWHYIELTLTAFTRFITMAVHGNNQQVYLMRM